MTRTMTWTMILAVLACGVLAGCTQEQWNRMERQWQGKPADYDRTPLGPDYDTSGEIATLNDAILRNDMTMWFQHREEYRRLWIEHGDEHVEVNRERSFMATLLAVIQDRADNLRAMGYPLSGTR